MTKELFIQTLDALKKQQDYDNKCNDAFKIILPNDFISGYDNSILEFQILAILKEAMDDKADWITWFVYEKDFGKLPYEAWNEDDTEIDLSDSGKLYDFLISEK